MVLHTATAPASAPTTNQSALRCRRCQNVPPFPVATAASRSRVRAFNLAALSVERRGDLAGWLVSWSAGDSIPGESFAVEVVADRGAGGVQPFLPAHAGFSD